MSSADDQFKPTFSISNVKNSMRKLDLEKEAKYSSPILKYFNTYNLPVESKQHYFGYFYVKEWKLAGHVFMPENLKATVFVLHGLFDHSGYQSNVIRILLEHNYAVALFDLPGHGLSSGDKVSINDFSDYVFIFNEFLKKYSAHLPKPYHIIAHSTGCSIVYEYIYHEKEHPFDKIVFLTPLIHSQQWVISKISYICFGWFLKNVPRTFRDSTNSKNFNDFLINDPLQYKKVPLTFVKALFNWNKRIEYYEVINQDIYIIQGDQDSIVDWKYNVSYLTKKIPTAKVNIIKNGKHHLQNEIEPIRTNVLNHMIKYIEKD
ncbi:MAG: alpha/beta hydrolase [bacterium]